MWSSVWPLKVHAISFFSMRKFLVLLSKSVQAFVSSLLPSRMIDVTQSCFCQSVPSHSSLWIRSFYKRICFAEKLFKSPRLLVGQLNGALLSTKVVEAEFALSWLHSTIPWSLLIIDAAHCVFVQYYKLMWGPFRLANLSLAFESTTQGYLSWVMKYLCPLSHQHSCDQ